MILAAFQGIPVLLPLIPQERMLYEMKCRGGGKKSAAKKKK
jgi:hypothetical protein